MRVVKLSLFLLLFPLFAASGKNLDNFAIARIARAWVALDNALADYFAGRASPAEDGNIRETLAAAAYFKTRLVCFSKTRLYGRYQTKIGATPLSVVQLGALVDRLADALAEGDRRSASHIATLVRLSILDWQNFDAKVLEENIKNYFFLFIVFMSLSVSFIVFLLLLVFSLRRARRREEETSVFSRLLIQGQEAERQRVSFELHDAVLPELRRFSTPDGDAASGERVLAQQKLVTERIRAICMKLLPPDFTRTGFQDVVFSLCDAFAARTGLESRFAADSDIDLRPLSPEMQLHCYRIIQEALNNIEKHARASEAIVVLRNGKAEGRKTLLVCVSDDGRGIPADARRKEGLGMLSMRRRAALLGATLNFVSEEGAGAMVRLELPLKNAGH